MWFPEYLMGQILVYSSIGFTFGLVKKGSILEYEHEQAEQAVPKE